MSKTEEIALARLGRIATAGVASSKRDEDALLRAIVADNRNPVFPMEPPALPQGVVGADRVVTGNDGPSWTNTDWRPKDERPFNQLMDAEDKQWRAERAAELSKLKGAKP
jgi:hypothetical protein